MLLVSACGFPEFENFDPLIHTFKHMAEMQGMKYLGEILRPFAEALSRRSLQDLFVNYYGFVRKAGAQLAKDGRISNELQLELRRDLFPGGKEVAYQLATTYWEKEMDRFASQETDGRSDQPGDAIGGTLPSAPRVRKRRLAGGIGEDVNEATMNEMAAIYDPTAIPNLLASIQMHFKTAAAEGDSCPVDWYIRIVDGRCDVFQGQIPMPTLRISTAKGVWKAIAHGKLDPVEAFADGLYEADGSMELLSTLPHIFRYSRSSASLETSISPPSISEISEKTPRHADLPGAVANMAAAFNVQAAGNLCADIQFCTTDAEPRECFLRIEERECAFCEGLAEDPTLTIYTSSDVWLSIIRGEIDGARAFTEQLYRVEGDFSLLMRLNELFNAGR
jgi:putative sterol carrier protein